MVLLLIFIIKITFKLVKGGLFSGYQAHHLLSGKRIAQFISALGAVLALALLPCSTAWSAGPLVKHVLGTPATGSTYFSVTGGCSGCHGTPTPTVTTSAFSLTTTTYANGQYVAAGAAVPLGYLATNPANITTAATAVGISMSATNLANATANQNDLSAYFASLLTPVLAIPAAATIASATAYSYQVLPPAAPDYLVSTTTYAQTGLPAPLTFNTATGTIGGSTPTVTVPTTYNISLTATNAGAATPTSAAVTLALKVMGAQTITFGAAPAVVVAGTGTVSATGGSSGNAVTFTSTTPTICTIIGTTVTGVAVGTCTIAANQAGTANNYTAAPQMTQSFAIGQGTQIITFGAAPAIVFNGTGTVTATGGGSGNAVTFTSTVTPIICSVTGSTVTGLAAGTCTITANQLGNTNYLAASATNLTFTIGKATQIITFGVAPAITYLGAGTVSATGGGSLNAVTFTSATPAVCTATGTNGSTITSLAVGTCTITANQLGNANYAAATPTNLSFTIGQASQTITFGAGPTVLVGGTGAVGATGGGSGNAVTFTSLTPTICTVTGSTVSGVLAGTCTIAANQLGNANYLAAAQATQNIAVGLNPQTITFGAAPTIVYLGTGTVSAAGGASGNPVTFSSSTPAVCTVIGSTVTGAAAGTCTIVANQAGNATYAAATNSQTFPIGQASQVITFGAAPAVVVSGIGTVSAAGGASGDAITFTSSTPTICTIIGNTVTGVAVGTCTIAANQLGNANYAAAGQATQSFPIGQGSQTITLGAAPAIVFNGTGIVSATGGLSGNTVSFTSLTPAVCTVAGTTVTGVSAGTCTIAANQAGNVNYTAAPQVTQNITIGKASQTITFGAAPALAVGGTGTVSATATSGLAVTFTSTTPATCTVTGTTVTAIGAGTCTIAANQAGNANYNAAPQITQNISVAQGSQSITFSALPALLVGGTVTVSATASSGLVVSFSSLTAGICSVSGTTVTGLAAGTCTIAANQAGNANYTAAPQVTQSISVTVLPPSASAVSLSTQLNTPATLDLASHIAGISITGVGVSAQPVHGTVTVAGTKVTYTPAQDYFGTDAFAYVAYNAGGVSPSAATVSVSVTGRPDPTKDARVTGLINAQAAAVTHFSKAYLFNLQQRMESLHRAMNNAAPATDSVPAPVPGPDSVPTPTPAPADQGINAPATNASPGQNATYFNSWDSGRTLAYSNNPNAVFHPTDPLSNGLPAANNAFDSMLASVVTGLMANSSLNLATVSNALGENQGDAFNRLDVWAAGTLRFGKTSQAGTDTQFATDGISIGVDKQLSSSLTAGLGMGYARDNSTIGIDGTNSKASGNSVAGYASYQIDSGTFIDGLLGFGKINFDTNRYVPSANDFARATRAGDQLFGSLSLGYEYRNEGFMWSPYGRYDFSFDRLNAGTETGAGTNALSYANQNLHSASFAFGIRANSAHQTDYGLVQPHIRLEYLRGIQTIGQTSVAYADLLGSQYSVTGTSENTNSFALGLGSDFLFSDTTRVAVDFQHVGSSGSQKYHALNVRLTKTLNGKNDLESLLGASYSSFITKPSGLVVAAGFSYDDNVSRASNALDKLSDSIYSLNVSKSYSEVFSKRHLLKATGFFDIEKFRTYTGLDQFTGGVQVGYEFRPSGEFGSPTYGVFARLSADQFNSTLRDGSRRSVGITLRDSLTDRINFFTALSDNVRTGKSDVFNTHDQSLRVNLDYALAPNQTIYLTPEFRRGDLVSSGRPSLAVLDLATVFVRDDVFNSPAFYAYRAKGKTSMLTVGYNLSFGPKDSIDISWRGVKSTPDMSSAVWTPVSYVDNQVSVSYLMAF